MNPRDSSQGMNTPSGSTISPSRSKTSRQTKNSTKLPKEKTMIGAKVPHEKRETRNYVKNINLKNKGLNLMNS